MKSFSAGMYYFFSLTISLYSAQIMASSSEQRQLLRGAKLFMTYCSGCHSLHYLRLSQLARDVGLIKENGKSDVEKLGKELFFSEAKAYDTVKTAIPLEDARVWFGAIPPDLSLIARQRGSKWLFNYLNGFYADKNRPFGTNNLFIPNVAMPNVLAPMALTAQVSQAKRKNYIHVIEDIVYFLNYSADPSRQVRFHLGLKVLSYLFLFLLVALGLKKSIWRDLNKP